MDPTVVTGIGGIERIERAGKELVLVYKRGGDVETLQAEAVVLSTGWLGNLDGLNLAAAGVQTDGRYVVADETRRTSAPHIFAAGDIDGRMMLVQSAGYEARIATENAVLGGQGRKEYRIVPHGGFTNPKLIDDIPPRMFVTCLYALLDPASGRLQFANAGHDLPFHRSAEGVHEMRATGMPLGLLPGMGYEEKEITLAPGDTVFFYSDGLAEAHSPGGEMYGFLRVQALLTGCHSQDDLIACSLDSLAGFTGLGWEQEDDVTLVTLHRSLGSDDFSRPSPADWRTLAEIEIASQPGNERQAAEQVAAVVAAALPPARLERLKTVVAEATMNAMEHGNQYQPDMPVQIRVEESPVAVRVRIVDQGGGQFLGEAETPDLDAKLAGLQSPRGWGLFLIQAMVDEMHVSSDDRHHALALILNRDESDFGSL